jgi:DNA-binding CsgD family transcriptional regulator
MKPEMTSRVAEHIAGQRLSGERPATPEAVLDPDGRLVHAEAAAKSEDAREHLSGAVQARERARGKLRRVDPDLAIAEWKGLVAARWTLVDQFDSDGRRYLLARKNDPETSGLGSLTERERCAVGYAAQGYTNKVIAYEMGIAASTVSVLLLRAARRLGAGSRAELIRAFLKHSDGDQMTAIGGATGP